MDELRAQLRSLRVAATEPLSLDPDAAPREPMSLFRDWLGHAIAAGVSSPHAMVLATATASAIPTARTVLLRDVTDAGLWFASRSTSPKGRDLVENPACSLLFYWREQGRQVRVAGLARPGPREASERDFLSRHPSARAEAIAGIQSEPVIDEEAALAAAHALIAADEGYVPSDWHAYVVEPRSVEFWQAGQHHDQTRVRYDLRGADWNRQEIWP